MTHELATLNVPFGSICGYAPGGIPAYSNGSDSHYSSESHYRGKLFLGIKFQCVEFARRWLLYRKGLLLPQYAFAAHIIYCTHVTDLEGNDVPCEVVRNGQSTTKPEPDTIIIYPTTKKNIVGHIGVITEVGEDYVAVADQNRVFTSWGALPYSAKYPLRRCEVDGTYTIEDPEVTPSCWIRFPNCPNRPTVPAPRFDLQSSENDDKGDGNDDDDESPEDRAAVQSEDVAADVDGRDAVPLFSPAFVSEELPHIPDHIQPKALGKCSFFGFLWRSYKDSGKEAKRLATKQALLEKHAAAATSAQ